MLGVTSTVAASEDEAISEAASDQLRRTTTPPLLDAALFLYLPFFASVSRTFASSSDDPFITLRYAANLIHGYGAVFNQGQHVQGFTSPLHLGVAVLAYLIPGGDDLLKLKLASLFFGILAIREAGILLYGLDIPRWARRTGCVAVSTSWIVAFASGNGLETTLAMWLLMALTRRLVLDGPSRRPALLAVIAFAAVLARPDALLVLACMAAVGLLIERPRALWQRISWFGGAAVAVVGSALVGLLYFDDVLPNTYYAKDIALGRAISGGATYLRSTLESQTGSHAAQAILLVQLALLVAGIYAAVRRFPHCGYLIAVIAGQAVFILKSGGDWMHGGRFAAPAVIPLIVVELLGLVYAASFVQHNARPVINQVACVAGGAVLIAASISLTVFPNPVWNLKGADDRSLIALGGYEQYSHIWATLPNYLTCVRAGQLVAASEVGYLGFARQDLRILDIRGLTDRTIAKGSPASVKYPWGVADPSLLRSTSPVGRVLLREKPVVIATFDAQRRNTVLGGAYTLVHVPAFSGTSLYVPSRSSSCLSHKS